MTTKQHCPVQRWTWKSVPELSTNPQSPNQVSPLHNHYVSALYTISISHFCPAAPLTTKIISHPQHASTFWEVSMFSLFKLSQCPTVHFLGKTEIQVPSVPPALSGWSTRNAVGSFISTAAIRCKTSFGKNSEFPTWMQTALGKSPSPAALT